MHLMHLQPIIVLSLPTLVQQVFGYCSNCSAGDPEPNMSGHTLDDKEVEVAKLDHGDGTGPHDGSN